MTTHQFSLWVIPAIDCFRFTVAAPTPSHRRLPVCKAQCQCLLACSCLDFHTSVTHILSFLLLFPSILPSRPRHPCCNAWWAGSILCMTPATSVGRCQFFLTEHTQPVVVACVTLESRLLYCLLLAPLIKKKCFLCFLLLLYVSAFHFETVTEDGLGHDNKYDHRKEILFFQF